MRGLAVLMALAFAACGPPVCTPDAGDDGADDARCACGAGPGSIEVGAGGSRLRPLADGDSLTIVRGAQGGMHVLVGAWVRDMDVGDVVLHYRLEDGDGTRVGLETRLALDRSLLDPVSATTWQRHPDLLVLDDSMANVEAFAGRTFTLHAEAWASDGTHACDAREVVLASPD